MQIYAVNSLGALLNAQHAKRGEVYQCPECHTSVRLRGGHLRQLHFYHLNSTPCKLGGKSLTHLQIQYALQKMLGPDQVFLEHRFPQIGRIADLYWPSQKLVFEIQVSPISADEVKERNHNYCQIGLQVVWILHDRHFNRPRLSPTETYLRYSPHYFTNINALGRGIFYDQYVSTRFKRRLGARRRFPVKFTKITLVGDKQFPRHFPSERKKWNLSFEGDLLQRGFSIEKSPFPLIQTLIRPYRILFHFLLEKTTY